MSGHELVRPGRTAQGLAMLAVLGMAAATALAQEQNTLAGAGPEVSAAELAPAATTGPAESAVPPAAAELPSEPQAAATSMPATAPAPAAVAIQPEPVKMSRPGTFEIHVQAADLRGVLQLLSTQGRKNIVATKEVSGTVTADLYGVTFQEALDAILKAAGFVYVEKDNFIYVYTPKQLADALKSEQQMVTRIFRLAYVSAADAKPLVQAALSDDGTVSLTPEADTGVGTSDSETGGNSYALNDVLVVRDYEPYIKKVEAIIEEIDARPEQVLIEVTILSATVNDSNALGINFSTLAGVDFEGVNLGASAFPIGQPTNPRIGPDSLDAVTPSGAFKTDFTTVSNGFSFGVMTNNLAMFISALESVTDTTILANPKLLVVNKQHGEVLVGSRDGYLVTTVTEGQTTQSVQFLETGTRLVVRPFVGKDGYIRLEIHPEDSQGTVTVTEGLALPTETTTELTTNMMVRDGRTIVMGGLFREEIKTARNQIPGLGNLPLVGGLFRYTKDNTDRSEIVMLMTPHIIRHETDEAVSEQFKEDVERFRMGHRKGIRWWGRERLAQMHMRVAKNLLADGHTSMALWNIDLALSMQPRLMEAIDLKEQITDKVVWASEGADSPVHYVLERMIMHELGRPVEEVLPPAKPRRVEAIAPEVRQSLGMQPRRLMPLEDYLAPAVAPSARHGVCEKAEELEEAQEEAAQAETVAPAMAEPPPTEEATAPEAATEAAAGTDIQGPSDAAPQVKDAPEKAEDAQGASDKDVVEGQ